MARLPGLKPTRATCANKWAWARRAVSPVSLLSSCSRLSQRPRAIQALASDYNRTTKHDLLFPESARPLGGISSCRNTAGQAPHTPTPPRLGLARLPVSPFAVQIQKRRLQFVPRLLPFLWHLFVRFLFPPKSVTESCCDEGVRLEPSFGETSRAETAEPCGTVPRLVVYGFGAGRQSATVRSLGGVPLLVAVANAEGAEAQIGGRAVRDGAATEAWRGQQRH